MLAFLLTVIQIFALNALVYLAWRPLSFRPFMYKWFSNSFSSRALLAPMLLSVFSHQHFFHFLLNMYVLNSFAEATQQKFLGGAQFLAFFLSAGLFGSLASLIEKSLSGRVVRSLGASGAVMGLLAYTCLMIPDSQLQIIFVPSFTFSASSAITALMAFDMLGLLLRWRMFDHAAHLGGAVFGLLYAHGLQDFIWNSYGDWIVEKHEAWKEEDGKKKRK